MILVIGNFLKVLESVSNQGLTQIAAKKNQYGIVNEYVKNITRESQLLKKEFSDLSWPIVLFLMIVCVVPLGTTLNQSDLINIVSGVFWVSMLLVMIFASNRLLHPEFNQGVLDQLIVKKRSLSIYCFIKLCYQLDFSWFADIGFIAPTINGLRFTEHFCDGDEH